MKKMIIFAFFTSFIFFMSALGVSLCAKDSIVTIVLDPSIDGTNYGTSYNNDAHTWKVKFTYGVVMGISTCLDLVGLQQGEVNSQIRSPGGENTGQNCWCKMTHPMNSWWVYNDSIYSYSRLCENYCAARCADSLKNTDSFREVVFTSLQP